MARILNQVVGKGFKEYNNLTQDTAGVLTGPLNKLWRAKILLNRTLNAAKGLEWDKANDQKWSIPNGALGESQASSKIPRANKELQNLYRLRLKHFTDESVEPDPAYRQSARAKQDAYFLKIQDRNPGNNQIIIYNTSTSPYQYIILQNRPLSLDYRGETTWATIKSMGRNTPMYHYTGSEDILQFNISWFCNDPDNPNEVLYKCRLLEMWTKSNGYQAGPPILSIEWGTSDMFLGHKYILSSATYTLSNFRNAYRKRNSNGLKPHQEVIGLGLNPAAATQELIFRRVSAYNLSNTDIVTLDELKNTKGIVV